MSPHVINMMGYIDNLERLGSPLSRELATDIILQSLPSDYSTFVMNFNMHNLTKTLSELHGMLKTMDQDIRKTPTPNVILV